jgi:glycosyltransferase involved in cell wall biosynthesis
MPNASKLMGEKGNHLGGWMASLAESLSQVNDIKLCIAYPKNNIAHIEEVFDGKVFHFAIPRKMMNYDNSMEVHFAQLVAKCNPDIVHLHGTEFAHGLALMKACPREKYVVSIQGLVSIYAKHYFSGLPPKVVESCTLRDFIKRDNIPKGMENYQKRGVIEQEILKNTQHVIGRTEWDKACTRQLAPNAQYHFCNESLRGSFYEHSWSLSDCQNHSIFLSQGGYPIKGLHFVLEALPAIRERFPDVHIYVAGANIINTATITERLRLTSYGQYIIKLLKKHDLFSYVTFLGAQNEEDMCKQYLQAHVFVSPSSIENSPNSLGEAMLLGVPSVASAVGGVVDLMLHRQEGFVYQYDASYMLAHYVCEIFSNDHMAEEFSQNAKKRAQTTHDKEVNLNRLLAIYRAILERHDDEKYLV